MSHYMLPGDIVRLNVGGTRFVTSRQTLTWIPDSFFTSMLSGRIATLKDEKGSIFIDRDPKLFSIILNYMRTKVLELKIVEISSLRHEAEFYGLTPLIKRLILCEDLNQSSCGDILFHGYLPPPVAPAGHKDTHKDLSHTKDANSDDKKNIIGSPSTSSDSTNEHICADIIRPGSVFQVVTDHVHHRYPISQSWANLKYQLPHSELSYSASDIRNIPQVHSRTSLDLRHSRNSSADLTKNVKVDFETLQRPHSSSSLTEYLCVRRVKGHHNWIAVSYAHFVCCYRLIVSTGWQLAFTSPYIEPIIDGIALNAKVVTSNQTENSTKMLAISHDTYVRLWGITEDGTKTDIGVFQLNVPVDHLFFIGSQCVALSHTGKVGVWHSMTQHWQIQDVAAPITSFDTAGSFLLLGCNNGSVYYIDMQKFPLRMKDNDLLVTELYHDPSNDVITAVSVYLTSKNSCCGNWIEIAYGTSSGTVRVIVQHPETVGHGPQLFQTFTVHRSPITKVVLSQKYLISVCSEYSHVRTWSVTRFRGMISTQPRSTPLCSFKVVSLEDTDHSSNIFSNESGPYGEQDDVQVFIQKVVPETDKLYVRYASSGQRICVIKSVDSSTITTFCVHECEGSNRMGSRPRRYIFTGHSTGAIQMWDLTTALDLAAKSELTSSAFGGPSPEEMIFLLDQCDITGSHCSTPCISPPLGNLSTNCKVKATNIAFLQHQSNKSENNPAQLEKGTNKISHC